MPGRAGGPADGFAAGCGAEPAGAAGFAPGGVAPETSAMTFSAAALLTEQALSQIRHCASVYLHPHVQLFALS